MASKIRDEALKIIQTLGNRRYYMNRPDFELGDKKYSSAAILSTAVALAGKSALVVGDPGLGKTTASEYVGALSFGLPLDFVLASEIHGSPEQTEEKMIARPDLGALNQGSEKVIFNNFVYTPVKIVDEINRLPETKQGILLNGIDRRLWSYLNATEQSPKGVTFATMNYPDRGTVSILPPLADRFTVTYEAKHPGANMSWFIANTPNPGEELFLPAVRSEIEGFLQDKTMKFDDKIARLKKTSEQVAQTYRSNFGAGLSMTEREQARTEIDAIAMKRDSDANALGQFIGAEFTHSKQFGQVRSNEKGEQNSHDSEYICANIENPASIRAFKDLSTMSKAMAWLEGATEVGVQHVQAVAPYVLAHRIRFTDNWTKEKRKEEREDYAQMYFAKSAVNDLVSRFAAEKPDVKYMLAEAVDVYKMNGKDRRDAAKKLAEKANKKDQPFYRELAKDLMIVANE